MKVIVKLKNKVFANLFLELTKDGVLLEDLATFEEAREVILNTLNFEKVKEKE
jgi:maltodextrin utilization protein YvdJ